MESRSSASGAQLVTLLFLHAFATGMYVVPLTRVLIKYGLEAYLIGPFVLSSLASLIAPLIFGSLADRRVSPERLFSVTAFSSSILLVLSYLAVQNHWGAGIYLVINACYHLIASPGWGLLTGIVLANLAKPEVQFPPLRAAATVGWMVAGFLVSWWGWDESTWTGYAAAVVLAMEAVFCLTLPANPPRQTATVKRWRDYFGWEALKLMAHRDHRLIFLTTALVSIPVSVFYIYAPIHLNVWETKTTGWMSLAQISETLGMFLLPALLAHMRLKWVLSLGLCFATARYLLFSGGTLTFMIMGICLHGLIYTFWYTTTQIYVEQRIDPRLRNQSQALLNLMTNGIGNLIGYFLAHILHRLTVGQNSGNWWVFWSVEAGIAAFALAIFAFGYRGRTSHSK